MSNKNTIWISCSIVRNQWLNSKSWLLVHLQKLIHWSRGSYSNL